MKKILLLLVVVSTAFIMVISSCTKEADKQEEVVEKSQENPSEIEMGDGVHSITLSFPETKTAFGDSEVVEGKTYYKKNWTVGDKICINGRESLGLEDDNINEDKSSATFYFEEPIPSAEGYQVVYPSKAYNSSTKKVTIPAKQTFISGNFDKNADIILGYGTNLNDITLSNAVAYLKIRLKKGDYGNFGVKEVKLEAIGKKLNGEFDIADGGLALTVPSSSETASEQAITLDASAINPLLSDAPTEFLLAVAPQTLGGGFTVTITDTKDNTMSKTKPSSAELAAGGILAQQAFNFQEYRPIATADDLLAFAAACSAGDSNYWLITDNIDMDGETWPEAGTDDSVKDAFNGVLDGGNLGTENGGYKISNLTSTTGSFINFVYNGTVKNVTLDNTCSISHSGDVKDKNYFCVGMIGMSRGSTSYCFNKAILSCSSTYDNDTRLYVGGIVGRQYKNGTISHCYNFATVGCTASISSGDTAGDVYVGGIVASLERPEAGNKALIEYCTNSGNVTANPAKESFLHVGGVAGKIESVNGASDKLTITNLVNTGNVTKTNSNQKNDIAVLVAGLIGGIHGSSISSKTNTVVIENSYVSNCTVQNGAYNNTNGYGTASHTGGLFGVVRGVDTGQNIDIKSNCYANNVSVICRRGYAGGLSSWLRGTTVDGCKVLASSVKGSLAQCWHAGGISGYTRNSVIKNCDVTLTKDSQYSLYTSSKECNTGGIVGYVTDACSVINCRANVELMYQGTYNGTTGTKEGHRGWVAGIVDKDGTLSINKCGVRGTYGVTTASFTVTSENYADNLYGSDSAGTVTVGTGDDACYYWDGTL